MDDLEHQGANDEHFREPRVLVIGGGFGGLACARKLDGKRVDVLLVDVRNYHLFTPLLYQVGTALLNPSDVAYPLRAVFRRSKNVRFRQSSVSRIDLEKKRAYLADGEIVAYDYVVLATGSANSYFGNRDLARHTLGVKTLEEALRVRNHLLACLELASQESDEDERTRLLTFVIVGGGPTGVEYAGALAELLKLVVGRDYPDLTPAMPRIVLVEGRDRLLDIFPERLGRYSERVLSKRGVDVRTAVLVERADDDHVLLADGSKIGTRTVIWAAGVWPAAPGGTKDVARSRTGRIVVDEHLRIDGREDAFAVGDLASLLADGHELPMLSPFAMQAGRHAARMILEDVARGSGARTRGPRRFRYVDKGVMATIGRNAAVGQIGRFKFTGFVGWVAWLVVHIYYLIGFRNRLAVLLQWGWEYVRRDRPIRIIARSEEDNLTRAVTSGRTGQRRRRVRETHETE